MNIVTNPKLIEIFKNGGSEFADPFPQTVTNTSGQLIQFYEHPINGDMSPVYASIEGVLFNTGFYELDDMEADHGEYTPHIIDGVLMSGYELADVHYSDAYDGFERRHDL